MDQRRLYEVGPGGGAWTTRHPAAGGRHLVRLRWLVALGIGANAASWTLAGAALGLGGREWGAACGLLALATTPLLALPVASAAASRLLAWRRHRERPDSFPPE